MLPSAKVIVARFLRANGFEETLNAFIGEAGLDPDVGSTSSGDNVTLEQILQEKQSYDLTMRFEKLGVADAQKAWRLPGRYLCIQSPYVILTGEAPHHPTKIEVLSSQSNILSVHVQKLALPAQSPRQYILATTANRRVSILDVDDSSAVRLIRSLSGLQDSPVLDVAVIGQRYLLLTSMSGRFILHDLHSEAVIDERRDHTKYIVKVSTWSDESSTYIATAGWDSKVLLYRIELANGQEVRLGAPIASLTLSSIPETVLFVQDPDSPTSTVLLLTRRDSTFLYYYVLPSAGSDPFGLKLRGKQNLAPHSNAWVAFTPSAVQVCPTDPLVVAVATSSLPHMKLIIVRLLIPPTNDSPDRAEEPSETTLQPPTQASQARAERIVQDREEAAILLQCSTMAPQTQYSTPALAWRPDGTGVWVNGDDGIVRGIEACTGKVTARLEAHGPGSKVRCLWAGVIKQPHPEDSEFGNGEEWLISGGFDQQLVACRAG